MRTTPNLESPEIVFLPSTLKAEDYQSLHANAVNQINLLYANRKLLIEEATFLYEHCDNDDPSTQHYFVQLNEVRNAIRLHTAQLKKLHRFNTYFKQMWKATVNNP